MQSSAALAAHQPAGVALDQELGLEIERGERLVEEQHVGVVDQRARKRHALAHAARERRGIVVGKAVQAELVEHGARALFRVAARHAPDLEAELHVGDRRAPGQQQVLLQHVAGFRRDAGEHRAVPPDLAGTRRKQPGEDIEQRRLPAAGGADDGDDLARLQLEADLADDRHGAPAVVVE